MTKPYEIESAAGVEVRITRGDGKPLMLLTRMASGGMGIWDAVWSDLARHFTVANFDLVGAAGLSEDMPARDRFMALADTTSDMATRLGFDRYHVFGWYGGCHVALACAARHPKRVASCLLLDPFYELEDNRKIEKAIEFKKVLFEHPDRELYAYYWVMAGFSPAFLENEFDTVERMAKARIAADRFVTLDTSRWMRWVRALRTNWLEESDFPAMTAPTLVLATALDSWHAGPTVGMAEALTKRLPSADLKVVEGLGTFFFTEDPARFRDLAAGFLERSAKLR
ncbi:MAG: alpha/beta hydrolase [Tagaea sp.]|nr:alpha/beta hydrolase [Tagaea sp.]